jgi:uncharacterized membrane protein YkvA (DUF1232 family)
MQNIKKFVSKYWILILSAFYILWPIDLIADLFGPIGLIDDGGILVLAIIKIWLDARKAKKESK